MSEELKEVADMLAVVNAQIDQSQALIDDARSKFQNNAHMQMQLMENQLTLDILCNKRDILKTFYDRLNQE